MISHGGLLLDLWIRRMEMLLGLLLWWWRLRLSFNSIFDVVVIVSSMSGDGTDAVGDATIRHEGTKVDLRC